MNRNFSDLTVEDEYEDVDSSKGCQTSKECQWKYSNPWMECLQEICQEKKCKSNSVCPMDSLCIKGNCIDVAMVRKRICSLEGNTP
jgi:hypothetical protein